MPGSGGDLRAPDAPLPSHDGVVAVSGGFMYYYRLFACPDYDSAGFEGPAGRGVHDVSVLFESALVGYACIDGCAKQLIILPNSGLFRDK